MDTEENPHVNDFLDCNITTTCFTKGETVKTVWILDNINAGKDLAALASEGDCNVEVGTGDEKIRLRFFLTINEETVALPKYNEDTLFRHLSLWAQVKSHSKRLNSGIIFKVKVDMLYDDLRVSHCVMNEKAVSYHPSTDSQGKLIEKYFLEFQRFNKSFVSNCNVEIFSEERHNKSAGLRFYDTRSLQFGISVTLLNLLKPTCEGVDGATALDLPITQAFSQLSLIKHLKTMYADQDNFADIKLETKDGLVTSAHKFILAARSPVLKELILEETSKESFSGIIKISDFNAKAILAILHWIYTGELSDRTGFLIEEVVLAAKKYQLTDMLEILDKEMITICNTGNMFQLFDAAKQNGLVTAMLQVSEFIKENIGSMVGQGK